MFALELSNINKSYANHKAVDNISLSIPEKSIYGLLGPNGAGKTSLIRIITQITAPDSGEIRFFGEKQRSTDIYNIGYMPEERGLYKRMKVGEQLMYLAQLKNLSAAEAKKKLQYWFKKFEIEDWWNKKVSELSKGMQQKIQFIATIIHNPKLLILDEPFSGLDPVNSNLIKDEIKALRDNGATIIFSTHRMEQVEEMCDEITLIHNGKNILSGSVDNVKQQFKKNLFRIEFSGDISELENERFHIEEAKKGEAIIKIREGSSPNDLLQYFLEHHITVRSFNEILPSLNEIFIQQVNT